MPQIRFKKSCSISPNGILDGISYEAGKTYEVNESTAKFAIDNQLGTAVPDADKPKAEAPKEAAKDDPKPKSESGAPAEKPTEPAAKS